MLWWNNLKDDQEYVIDLVQSPGGVRKMRFREKGAEPHPDTALSTVPLPGSTLRTLGRESRLAMNVPIDNGEFFLLDPHGVWVTKTERDYLATMRDRRNMNQPGAPWVNGIAPVFPPA